MCYQRRRPPAVGLGATFGSIPIPAMPTSPLRTRLPSLTGHLATLAATGSLGLLAASGPAADAGLPLPRRP